MTVRIIEFETAAGESQVLANVLVPTRHGDPVLATVDLMDRKRGRRIGPEEVADSLPVDVAFLRVIGVAEREGIPFVWVHDPHDLFPPERRPVREVPL